MGCFEDCLKNINEPYGGNMPLFNSPNVDDASVTIVSQSYDDGMKVTRISTPPRTETRTLIDVIDQALGLVHNLDIDNIISEDNKDNKKKSEKKDGDKDVSRLQSSGKSSNNDGYSKFRRNRQDNFDSGMAFEDDEQQS